MRATLQTLGRTATDVKCQDQTPGSDPKGENNRKCGNRYLAWAFVEAANFARQHHEHCRKWFDRKAARTNKIIATKALACKLAKAAWHLMSEGTDYDAQRMCPGLTGPAPKLEICQNRGQPAKGVGEKPSGLIGGRGSPQFQKLKLKR